MNRKLIEVVLMYLFVFSLLLTGCCAGEQYAPITFGELYNIHQGLTKWLAQGGDNLTKWYYNPETNMSVFARPFMDGWAFAVQKGDTAYGHLVNCDTWVSFRDWLTGAGGFAQMVRNLPNIANMPVVLMPVIVPASGEIRVSAWYRLRERVRLVV